VSSEKTLEQELAETIREAVRRAQPSAVPDPGVYTPPDPVRRAEEHLTPSVPEGASLFAIKKALVRIFRFLWREQAAFNALTLEAFRRERQEWEGRFASLRESTERELAISQRRAAVQDARFALLERPIPGGAPTGEPAAGPPAAEIPPAVYSLFEERFRGAPEKIAENQRFYLSFLRGARGPVLDAGCGRGEFLRLLAQERIEAIGVESNPVSVRLCRDAGLTVEEADAVAFLAGRPDASLGGVVAFQVVEHWPAARTFSFLSEARRALKPGGVLIAETVNTDSLSALRAFFLDPTHVRPVPPAALVFLAEAAGFADAAIEYRAPVSPSDRLIEVSENDAKLNRLLFAPQDYAVIARVPANDDRSDR
jgi:O-antigen chain-terminating methyltransferase